MYSNFGKKTIKYVSIEKIIVKKEKKKIKLIPDTNTKVSQVKIINNVWPISGCEINSKIIGNTIPSVKRYFKYKLFLFFKLKIIDIIIIKKGFTNSIGWNLGKNGKSSHLEDPFTSTPIKGINTKANSVIENNIIDILIRVFWSIKEKVITTDIPKNIKIKCLKKK